MGFHHESRGSRASVLVSIDLDTQDEFSEPHRQGAKVVLALVPDPPDGYHLRMSAAGSGGFLAIDVQTLRL